MLNVSALFCTKKGKDRKGKNSDLSSGELRTILASKVKCSCRGLRDNKTHTLTNFIQLDDKHEKRRKTLKSDCNTELEIESRRGYYILP